MNRFSKAALVLLLSTPWIPTAHADAPSPVVHSPPRIIMDSSCTPVYPRDSRLRNEAGTVTVAFQVGKDGRLQSSHIVKSSGFRALDRATLTALHRCSFYPAETREGAAVGAWIQFQYVWRLDKPATLEDQILPTLHQAGQ